MKMSRNRSWQLGLASFLATIGALCAGENRTNAQIEIAPDTTLGSENSTVTSTDAVDTINGGATRGTNLFHSFREFNVEEGRAAVFTNPAGIENILTRVTGANLSNLLGTLGVAGNANLFLLNPNGIIFGPNARLDVRGSFVATTANAIGFGERGVFSATNPSNAELLSVNPNAFLFNQIRTAAIQNNSVADSGLNPSGEFTARGLRVPDSKSLLLVGGDINMNGGGLYAFGGRVELGSLAGAGTVGLNAEGNNLSLSFPDSVQRSNVSLSNDAEVDVTAGDGGRIAVNARNLEMTQGSGLRVGIASRLGDEWSQAGSIEINATGAIVNNESFITSQVRPEARGQGGDISISASTLRLEDGAQVATVTFGVGKGGNLTVNASDVQLIGTTADGQSVSGLGSAANKNSTGDAGDLTLNTNTLLVQDGAQVSAATFGAGKGGNLTVNAASDVQLIGTSADGQLSSALSTAAQRNSIGDAGDLTINTHTLLVRDGAQIDAGTLGTGKGGNFSVNATNVQLIGTSANGQAPSGLFTSADKKLTGDGGNLTINTHTLLVRDGAVASAATLGAGKGGILTVNASDVQLIGTAAVGQSVSGLSASATRNSTGNAGDLTINTDTLLVQDGARVNVWSLGTGTAGNMRLNVRSIRLDNNGLLTANTQSALVNSNSEQATININSQNLIISRNSNIFTNATGENVIGGNINIDTDLLVALSNSDISANSTNFRGGNVRINASGIFGTQFREVPSVRTSDLTATGASPELSGTVELNTPDLQPNNGLVNLPSVPVDTSVAVACTPSVAQKASEFVVTGRGGLPDNPQRSLGSDAIDVDLVTLNPQTENSSISTTSKNSTILVPAPLVEATEWETDSHGKVVLTAKASTATPQNLGQPPAECRAAN